MSDTHSTSDADVIRASLAAPEAFGTIFDRHFPAVNGFCVRRVGMARGQDIAVEVFRRAFESRRIYDVSRLDARPWLFAIALNLVRGAHRSAVSQELAYERLAQLNVASGQDPAGGIVAAIDAERRLAAVAAALKLLPVEEVEALLLHCWEDLSYAEVARVLGIPIGTVRSRLSRVRHRLYALVGDEDPDQPSRAIGGSRA